MRCEKLTRKDKHPRREKVLTYYGFFELNRAEINYRKKKVHIILDDSQELTFRKGHVLSMIINSVKTRKMLNKGCMRYLVPVVTKVEESILSLQNTSIVFEFHMCF